MSIEQVELVQLFDSNIYLISGSKKIALVDTGIGFQVDDTIVNLKKMLNGRKLDILILTHRHFDHVGGANAIIKEFSPKVYAGRYDAPPLREGDTDSTLGTKFGGTFSPIEVNDLKEGDVMDLGGHRLRVLETPGHTIGSIAIYDETSGALFTGDTVFVGGVGKWTYPTSNLNQLKESLKRLGAMSINGLYPGHGPYVPKDGNEYIVDALRMTGVKV